MQSCERIERCVCRKNILRVGDMETAGLPDVYLLLSAWGHVHIIYLHPTTYICTRPFVKFSVQSIVALLLFNDYPPPPYCTHVCCPRLRRLSGRAGPADDRRRRQADQARGKHLIDANVVLSKSCSAAVYPFLTSDAELSLSSSDNAYTLLLCSRTGQSGMLPLHGVYSFGFHLLFLSKGHSHGLPGETVRCKLLGIFFPQELLTD